MLSSRERRVALSIALVAVAVAVAPRAAAQSSSVTDQALAQALFNQGKKLMAAGKYAEACAKFQASNRTAPGTGTLLNLAVCHEKLGRLASAWVEFSSAADADRREGNQRRLEYSQQQMQKLAPQLAHITINAPAGPAVPGLVVKLDGAALAPAALGVPAPVDPGKHVVAATAPGRQSWSKQITVAKNGENHEISIPALSPPAGAPAGNAAPSGTPAGGTPAGGTPPAGSAPQSGATSATPGGTPPTTTGKTSNPRRIGAYVAGGVGVVGIGLGSYFGLKAFSDWKKRNDNCPNGRCNQTAVTAHDSAHTAAIVSDVSFGVGVAALGAAAYLWFTSSPASSEKPPGAMAHWRVVPMVAQRGGGLRLGREF